MLARVAMSFSWGFSQTREQTQVLGLNTMSLALAGGFFTTRFGIQETQFFKYYNSKYYIYNKKYICQQTSISLSLKGDFLFFFFIAFVLPLSEM